MLHFQRHLFANSICWLITISACNLSSVIWRLSTTGKQTYNFNLLTFLGGFLLEIPLIALLSVITAVLMWSTHRAPAAIRTLTHGLFHLPVVLVIIFFYFASEFLHQQLGVYLSIDAFSMIFTDTKQLFLNAGHDAPVQIICAVVATCGITFLWIPATARLHTIAKKHSKITKSFLLLASAAFAITLSTYPFLLKHNLAPPHKVQLISNNICNYNMA